MTGAIFTGSIASSKFTSTVCVVDCCWSETVRVTVWIPSTFGTDDNKRDSLVPISFSSIVQEYVN